MSLVDNILYGRHVQIDVTVGATTWVIADGYIPPQSSGPAPAMTSHDSACILNAGQRDAHVELLLYFADREPVGPYALTVPARRAHHQRLNDLAGPEPVPIGVDYCCVITSDAPIVVQHTRLDSRQAANALMSTIAYPAG
jgi:hypothetical protein